MLLDFFRGRVVPNINLKACSRSSLRTKHDACGLPQRLVLCLTQELPADVMCCVSQGLDRVLIFTAVQGKILLRQCCVKYKKSGTDVRGAVAAFCRYLLPLACAAMIPPLLARSLVFPAEEPLQHVRLTLRVLSSFLTRSCRSLILSRWALGATWSSGGTARLRRTSSARPTRR